MNRVTKINVISVICIAIACLVNSWMIFRINNRSLAAKSYPTHLEVVKVEESEDERSVWTSHASLDYNDVYTLNKMISEYSDVGVYLKQGRTYTNEGIYYNYYWVAFDESDIDDEVNGYINIAGKWFKKSDVIFYPKKDRSTMYKDKRKKILKRGDEIYSRDYIKDM